MRSSMLKRLVKHASRELLWVGQRKTIKQVLASRCRRDGMPEYGRFTTKEIKRITSQAFLNVKGLMPYLNDLDNLGNYQIEFCGLLNLAIYNALVKEDVARDYAANLVADMGWQFYLNNKGVIPIIAPMRRKWWEITIKDPMDRLEKLLRVAAKFPYSEPGYRVKVYRDKDVWCMDLYSCVAYDFFKKFGQEEMAFFRKTWCTLDYTTAEYAVKGAKYQRTHTLSDGDELCDARYFIDKQV